MLRTVLLLFVLFSVAQCLYAQDARQQAWTVLNAGLTEKNPGERTVAVRVLGLMTNDPQAPDLAMQALSDPKPEVRAAAADALGDLNYQAARPKIREILLRNDEDPLLVLACARALFELGDEEAYAVYYAILTGERKSGLSLTESQKKNLSDPKKMAQMGFEQGLGFLPFASVGYGALKAVTKDGASPVQATAAKMLIKDPDPKTKEALINALNHKSWIVRTAAVDALARRDDATVIPQVEQRLSDDKYIVRYTAAAAIIRLSDLQDKSAQLRRSLR
ncbi:MAG TPA: HEAT repeat domain-containing protein [Terriglobales bacterium]|nr:HEAT repeat domain-containing protein [Terriglobales bacterium]